MSTTPTMPSRDQVREQERLRHHLLAYIMNTQDLEGLQEFLYDGLQSYANVTDNQDVGMMRREIRGKLQERLEHGVIMFNPADRGKSFDPLWLIDTSEGLGLESFNTDKLKNRITLRLRDEILYSPEASVSLSMDYFYELAGKLEIKLDDVKIEDTVYDRVESKLPGCKTMQDISMITDFMDANLPVGRAYKRQSPTLIYITFDGLHDMFEI